MNYIIAHNDLDGYTSQLFVAYSLNFQNITYFNTNYGKELSLAIETILSVAKPEDSLYIVDLNLTEEQAILVDSFPGFKLLMDHHKNGEFISSKYDWYYLDTSKSATKIVFEKLNIDQKFEHLSDIINVYDLWKEEDQFLLNKGRVLNSFLRETKMYFPKVLQDLKRDYIFHILSNQYEKLHFKDLENQKLNIDRIFFDPTVKFNDETLLIVRIFYFFKSLEKDLIHFEQNGFKGVVFQGLSEIFQEFSHILLKERPDIDFAVNISPQGHMSFRAIKDSIDLSVLCAEKWNGGGHPKAAGGSLCIEGLKIKEEQLIPLFLEKL